MKEYTLTTRKCMLLVKRIRWFGPAWLVNLISILLAHHTRREQSNSLKKKSPKFNGKDPRKKNQDSGQTIYTSRRAKPSESQTLISTPAQNTAAPDPTTIQSGVG